MNPASNEVDSIPNFEMICQSTSALVSATLALNNSIRDGFEKNKKKNTCSPHNRYSSRCKYEKIIFKLFEMHFSRFFRMPICRPLSAPPCRTPPRSAVFRGPHGLTNERVWSGTVVCRGGFTVEERKKRTRKVEKRLYVCGCDVSDDMGEYED